ncbi:DNA polymerase II large subunit [Candidatus Burarchaeum australiense]|nr:DNA polymerase II large subunit [Candidatus Burarchaeum australiense]
MTNDIPAYHALLQSNFEKAYIEAIKARTRGLDPSSEVEILPARDVAERVQGIVGPAGVALGIRAHADKPPEMIAYEVAKEILDAKYAKTDAERRPEKLIEQSIRTAVAILTEGVLVAPTEGITKVKIRENPDGSNYLAMYFSGPIRAAGGTVAALSVVIGDIARRRFNISDFRPTDSEVERYVEEINLYDARAIRLQYMPSDEEIQTIVRNCPVMITGDPTEKRLEVAVHKGLERMEGDRVRGGMCLVISEMCQKAAKVMKFTKKISLDWTWLERIVKVGKRDGKSVGRGVEEIYLDDVAAGRPIIAYPSRKGGFRLRYGRCRTSGIAGKAIHPATMELLDEFIVIGTQMKVERPGKGCVAASCDSIDGPTVKLSNGSVRKISTYAEALAVRKDVESIIALGDILIAYGDFAKANHPLPPSAWCEEWWALELKEKGATPPAKIPNAADAIKISERHEVPLHPAYTFRWHDITSTQLRELADWFAGSGKLKYDFFTLKEMRVQGSPAKAVLEDLCIPHEVQEGDIVLDAENSLAVLRCMGLLKGRSISLEDFNAKFDEKLSALELVNRLAGIQVRAYAPTYIGARMGRPEKAKQREMKPAPHVLFPIGDAGGKLRSISKAYRDGEHARKPSVELMRRKCAKCNEITSYLTCPKCNSETIEERICPKCGKTGTSELCSCGTTTTKADERPIDVRALLKQAIEKCGFEPTELKGVKGMMSASKIPERLEKGILRAKHKISVYKDGTVRFDATNMVLTHFTPREVGTPIEKLKELGYTQDYEGKPLTGDDQLLELMPQDLLLSENGGDYLTRVAQFIDDLLSKVYDVGPFYKISSRAELVGHLVVGLSPHTSCGVLSRIVGFTKAFVGYAHPYLTSARRRNCDGDEDSCMLLLDALLNFSPSFLPASRGGTMDAPIVLTVLLDPKEVDDEVHAMECVSAFSLPFYRATLENKMPGEVEVEQVRSRLGKPSQFYDIRFTHMESSIHDAPLRSAYVLIGSMADKVEAQFNLCDKIRAVDAADAANRVILTHFLPDLYGNLSRFSRQEFRCVECNTKYRRVPLSGKCTREGCGGKLLLTISKGSVSKYLKLAKHLIDRYHLPNYMSQRILLLEQSIGMVFRPEEEKEKQFNLEAFM